MKKLLIEIGKVITAIIVIGGAAIFLDNAQDDARERDENILKVVEDNSAELSMLAEGVNNLEDSLIDIQDELKNHHEAIGDLGWAIRNLDNFSSEQMEEILSRELKKNNGWSMMPIALPGVNSIPYEIDTELIGVK